VTSEGRCAGCEAQDALVGYFERLAHAHCGYCVDGPGPRPELSRKLAEHHGEDEPALPLLVTHDQTQSGRIMVCSDVAEDERAFSRALAEQGLTDQRPVRPHGARFMIPLLGLHVCGVDFQIYDPHGLYPGEDHTSCVFLSSDEFPALNSLIAKVSGPELCARITAEHSRARSGL
jgi:hypothetical protein